MCRSARAFALFAAFCLTFLLQAREIKVSLEEDEVARTTKVSFA
jgi:hypothetical protein